jgi:hypothetical protein
MPERRRHSPFEWQQRPFDLGDSPERYRALYSFSAANLNLSTSLWTLAQFLTQSTGPNRSAALAIIRHGRLGPISAPRRSGMDALRQSMLGSRELMLLCGEAAKTRDASPRSKRSPRFFLTKHAGSILAKAAFKDFVVGEAQESAMSLIAGELQLRDHVFAKEVSVSRAENEGASPVTVWEQIVSGVVPNRSAIVTWLGNKERVVSYKTLFNLACYFSREFVSIAAGPEELDRIATLSLDYLVQALATSPPEVRSYVLNTAQTDPSLVGVRTSKSETFAEILNLRSRPSRRLWANASPGMTDSALTSDIIRALIPDTTLQEQLDRILSRMVAPSGEIERAELLRFDSDFSLGIEEYLATELEEDPHLAADVRDGLSRLLFLPQRNNLRAA